MHYASESSKLDEEAEQTVLLDPVTQQQHVSNEDMILALAGQFKQLSHEPDKFR